MNKLIITALAITVLMFTVQITLATQLDAPCIDTVRLVLDSTSGVTTYSATYLEGGDSVIYVGWFPAFSGFGDTYEMMREGLSFDISSIPSSQSIDSAQIVGWMGTNIPANFVRFFNGEYSMDVWAVTSGSLATTGQSDPNGSDYTAPGYQIGTLFPTGSEPTTAPFVLDVTSTIRDLYNAGKTYAAFRYQIFSEVTASMDSTTPHHYGVQDGPTSITTTYASRLLIYYSVSMSTSTTSTTAVSGWQNKFNTQDGLYNHVYSRPISLNDVTDKSLMKDDKRFFKKE